MLDTLVKHINDKPIMQHDGFEWRTPVHLLNMGIACCSQCGNLLTEKQHNGWFCNVCFEVVLVISTNVDTKPFNKELAALQQWNRKQSFLARKITAAWKHRQKITIEKIMKVTAKHFGVSVEQILCTTRKREVVYARTVAIALSKEIHPIIDLQSIADAFYRNYHTDIFRAFERFDWLLKNDAKCKEYYNQIKNELLTPKTKNND